MRKGKTVVYETKTVISNNSNGVFLTEVLINGQRFQAVVDTGASYVSIDRKTAAILGIDYQNAFFKKSDTANGQIDIARVNLQTVRVGSIELYDVSGSVVEKPMDTVLIGMSFLNQVSGTFKNGQLELSKP